MSPVTIARTGTSLEFEIPLLRRVAVSLEGDVLLSMALPPPLTREVLPEAAFGPLVVTVASAGAMISGERLRELDNSGAGLEEASCDVGTVSRVTEASTCLPTGVVVVGFSDTVGSVIDIDDTGASVVVGRVGFTGSKDVRAGEFFAELEDVADIGVGAEPCNTVFGDSAVELESEADVEFGAELWSAVFVNATGDVAVLGGVGVETFGRIADTRAVSETGEVVAKLGAVIGVGAVTFDSTGVESEAGWDTDNNDPGDATDLGREDVPTGRFPVCVGVPVGLEVGPDGFKGGIGAVCLEIGRAHV